MTKEDLLSGIEVAVDEGGEGERVKVAFSGDGVLYLTPEQARALASRLIQTVYQAEVRTSLKRGRGQALAPAGRRVVEGGLPAQGLAPAGK